MIDDLVGRFRSGYVANKRPVALQEWRVTTGDPEVAEKIAALLDAKSDPAEWEASGEDNIEVYGSTGSVEIILEGDRPLRQSMVLFGRRQEGPATPEIVLTFRLAAAPDLGVFEFASESWALARDFAGRPELASPSAGGDRATLSIVTGGEAPRPDLQVHRASTGAG